MYSLRFSLLLALLGGLLWSCHTLPKSNKTQQPTTIRPALQGLLQWASSSDREGIDGALIELFHAADTSYVAHRQSNKDGVFAFDSLHRGDYLLRIHFPNDTIIRSQVALFWYDTLVNWVLPVEVLPSKDTLVLFDPNTFEEYQTTVANQWRRVEQVDKKDTIVTFDPDTFEEVVQVVQTAYEPSFLAPARREENVYSDGDGGLVIGDEVYEPIEENDLDFDVEAGQLTAGVLSDHNDWETWKNDVLHDLAHHARTWETHPTHRYCVQVLNQQKVPLPNQVVRLKDQAGTTHWEARTDNTGRVELWYALHNPAASADERLYAEVTMGGFTQKKNKLLPYDKGVNTLLVSAPCTAGDHIDVAWVVDATGSMDDEIAYLQAELADVMRRAQANRPTLTFEQASVFYKSEGDDYVTQPQAFTQEVETLVEFMKQQVADGGTSEEAVEAGLEVAINELQWHDNAMAKLLFLVLDEPPGHDTRKVQQLHRLMKQAAQKGIRIIPVAASGTDKSTEYLMRALALATNGHYVFLTDDSGIGNQHAEPTASIYRVELLNDLLVRLIDQATEIPFCQEEDPTENFKNNHTATYFPDKEVLPLKVYPNPAVRRITIEVPKGVSEVLASDVNGRLIAQWENLRPGKLTWNVRPYAVGFYFLHYVQNGVRKMERLVVVDD